MKKEKVEGFLGQKVIVTLFDGTNLVGELHKTGEKIFKNNPNLYIPRNYYTLINPQSCIFRSSHIKKMRVTYVNIK